MQPISLSMEELVILTRKPSIPTTEILTNKNCDSNSLASSEFQQKGSQKSFEIDSNKGKDQEQQWISSLQTYYTGSSSSPITMHRPQSPGALLSRYLKKSPSNDSGTGTCNSAECDRISPLRRRHRSCTSTASSTDSSESFESMQKKTKIKSGSSSLRLLKAIKRPSLVSFIGKTMSLGRGKKRQKENISTSCSVNIPTETNLDDSDEFPDTEKENGSKSKLKSTTSGLKTIKESLRAAKGLLTKSKNKPSATNSSHLNKKMSRSNEAIKENLNSKIMSECLPVETSSTPNTPKTKRSVFGKFVQTSKQKISKDPKKAASTSNLSVERATIVSTDEIRFYKSMEKDLQQSNSWSNGTSEEIEIEEKNETIKKQKFSVFKNLMQKFPGKGKEDPFSKQVDQILDSESLFKKPASASCSNSQEILDFDNSPKIRTPRSKRQKTNFVQERKDCCVEFSEMEVGNETVPVHIKKDEKHSSVIVTNKLSEKAKKSENSSARTSSVPNISSQAEQEESLKLRNTELPITQYNDVSNSEFFSEEPTREKEKVVEKKKKTKVVGSSSPAVNNGDNGAILETKLDQNDVEKNADEKKKDKKRVVDTATTTTNGNHQSSHEDHINSKSSVHTNVCFSQEREDKNAAEDKQDVELMDNIIQTPRDDKGVMAITKNEEDTTAVVNVSESQDENTKKDEDDEEPACTQSFMQLNPFDFNSAHGEKGKRERLYKVLVVGELGSGKTSIIKRYVHQFFSQHYRATIGVDFALKVLRWDGETVIRLQLWDIAGQERFGSMTRVYYKEAVGAFVVFDVTRSATLEAVPKWKADLDSKVALPDGRPIPTILLANKSDQPKEGIAGNREKMNEFCQQQGFSAWFETSAKDNINIDESANFLVSKILEMDRWSQEPSSPDPDKVDLSANGKHNPNAPSNCAC